MRETGRTASNTGPNMHGPNQHDVAATRPNRPWRFVIWFTLCLLTLAVPPAFATINLTLQTAGGMTISAGYNGNAGTVNALGVGTPSAGFTILSSASGALYATPYGMTVAGMVSPHTANLTAYVSSNFASPAAISVYSCPVSGGCGSSAGYSALSLSAAAPTTLATGVGNTSVTAYLGILVVSANGPSAFTGTQSATVTLTATEVPSSKTSTVTLTITVTAQTAVQLTLATAPGGASISAASDFLLSFGSVNGLGLSPAAGFTIIPSASGAIYSTPYVLQPVFSSFASTTGTLKVALGSNFAHPAVLTLQDAAASAGPYTTIPSGTALTIGTSITTGTNVTRYLGLLVSNVNGTSAYTGPDSATLTYTLVVP